jgi:formamidopyrimidine-DNA glycosylase
MPELPEVETVRRGLQQFTCNIPIEEVQVLLPRTIDHPDSALDFANSLQGLVITDWQRRGKYLLGVCADQQGQVKGWLGVHLRMTGQLLWLTTPTEQTKHTRVRLLMPQNQELRFVDQRTFGKMWWITANEEPNQVMGGLGKLGPEPFSAEFSVEYLIDRLHRSRRQIKAAILDQTLVAGVGNIYADESLFLSKILPTTVTTALTPQQIATLHSTIIRVLQDSIDAGGTTFSNYLSVTGTNGNYANQAWVYGRQGEICRACGDSIVKIKAAGRGTHYCPTCQH